MLCCLTAHIYRKPTLPTLPISYTAQVASHQQQLQTAVSRQVAYSSSNCTVTAVSRPVASHMLYLTGKPRAVPSPSPSPSPFAVEDPPEDHSTYQYSILKYGTCTGQDPPPRRTTARITYYICSMYHSTYQYGTCTSERILLLGSSGGSSS